MSRPRKLLMKHGANVNARESFRGQTALIWAAAQSQPAMVKLLISHHAQVNARSSIDDQSTAGDRRTARAGAAAGWHDAAAVRRTARLPGCAKHLVEGGMRILNLADPEGVTPMLIATENFQFRYRRLLIKQRRRCQSLGLVGTHAAVRRRRSEHASPTAAGRITSRWMTPPR